MATQNLIPLLILLVVAGFLAAFGFMLYSIAQSVGQTTREKMEKKHVLFSRDGMKVGVKELKDEDYKDRSQSILVNIWNYSSFPAYKSRLWGNGAAAASSEHAKLDKRKP
ncbi:hypothetical protein VTN96DRAFT_670 [Rasamsonia emersonii]|uniref:Uncharacterized protein n=1 Tax=Rasamsonia emersonii (strain ATCC 16479 / CBS 393.64 / IMI 116815) TaxID=1408163 RepID=A0A0F4Z362_RASE3|nr:Uncharacterized protein T310_1240 [Rasamsonia emersonii CBS 393.64]KKA24775.1 Uncharacterized protein T310_1240 [Rasamsonia emersonii CBS 393.64]